MTFSHVPYDDYSLATFVVTNSFLPGLMTGTRALV